ncbi:hypothetical protein KR054_002928, partial [Drosophila jambulina]
VKELKAVSSASTDTEALDAIVKALLPTGAPVTTQPSAEHFPADDCEVSEEEVILTGRSVRPKKAPGPDAVPNRVLKLAIALQSKEYATLYSKCLADGTFPVRWKRQKLMLLSKPGKPPGEPFSYRPICLTDTVSKVFEKIVAVRLNAAIEEAGGLSQRQFGFRKGSDTTVVGFADDIAVVVVAKERTATEEKANAAIKAIETWLSRAGLEIAAHKTEAVLVSSRKSVETAEVQVGGATIRSQRAIKYPGIFLDTRLSFKEQLE